MLRVSRLSEQDHLSILCIGAHSDDIEIGCGGTILRLIEEHPNLRFHWVVFSASAERAAEADADPGVRQAAARMLAEH